MIEFKKIHKSFGPQEVLKGLDLELGKGKIYSLLGPNGSGKTTLIKSALGLVIPDSGWISIQGEIVNGQWKYRDKIAYLPQIARFPENLKVKELIQLVSEVRGREGRPGPYIEAFELEDSLSKRLKYLSGGTRQKVNLVLCLMFDCPILILDEPTTGLDPITLLRLKEILLDLRKKGKTIVLSTHILQLAEELADEIIFLLDGTIYFQGRLEQIFSKTNSQDLEHAIAHLLRMNKKLHAQMGGKDIKMVI
jgi:Cu-processing system ATP-binding protein